MAEAGTEVTGANGRGPLSPRRPFLWKRAPSLLLLLAIPVFFLCLGANSIWDANEAFYVETPRQMVLTGDYVNPSFNGEPRFNKPVLSYWIVAGLYHLFGVSVAAERLGIALGAVGHRLRDLPHRPRARARRVTAVLAALVVATAPRVVMHGRRIFIDVYITAFMALALACFVWAERQPERRRRHLVLMYVAIGLAVLTKGPAFLALLGLIALVWLALERRLADIRRLMLVPGLLVVLAIVVPWYAEVFRQHGWTYITSFIFGENIDRFTSAMTPDGRSLGFFVPVLLSDLVSLGAAGAHSARGCVAFGAARRAAGPRVPSSSAVVLDCRDCRGVFALEDEGRLVHLFRRARRGGT